MLVLFGNSPLGYMLLKRVTVSVRAIHDIVCAIIIVLVYVTLYYVQLKAVYNNPSGHLGIALMLIVQVLGISL